MSPLAIQAGHPVVLVFIGLWRHIEWSFLGRIRTPETGGFRPGAAIYGRQMTLDSINIVVCPRLFRKKKGVLYAKD